MWGFVSEYWFIVFFYLFNLLKNFMSIKVKSNSGIVISSVGKWLWKVNGYIYYYIIDGRISKFSLLEFL